MSIWFAPRTDSGRVLTSLRVDGGATANNLPHADASRICWARHVRPAQVEPDRLGAARLAAEAWAWTSIPQDATDPTNHLPSRMPASERDRIFALAGSIAQRVHRDPVAERDSGMKRLVADKSRSSWCVGPGGAARRLLLPRSAYWPARKGRRTLVCNRTRRPGWPTRSVFRIWSGAPVSLGPKPTAGRSEQTGTCSGGGWGEGGTPKTGLRGSILVGEQRGGSGAARIASGQSPHSRWTAD